MISVCRDSMSMCTHRKLGCPRFHRSRCHVACSGQLESSPRVWSMVLLMGMLSWGPEVSVNRYWTTVKVGGCNEK
jgi:hypothetical protein